MVSHSGKGISNEHTSKQASKVSSIPRLYDVSYFRLALGRSFDELKDTLEVTANVTKGFWVAIDEKRSDSTIFKFILLQLLREKV